ncbi:MAG TPA: PaaI family thioesterase [Burkholderiaceae bacterium]|nr:PaaI family thioesterase [Burkholderiaceae bacterium]
MDIDPSITGWKPRTLEGFIGSVGPLWTRKENDLWAYAFVPTLQHTNPAGIVHGGLLMTLIDHALSAIAWEDANRRPCVTIQIDVRFLTAVRPHLLVEARGSVVRRTATLSFVEGNLIVGAEIAVTASAILKIL